MFILSNSRGCANLARFSFSSKKWYLTKSLTFLFVLFLISLQFRMHGNSFVSALLYALIGFDILISIPIQSAALSLQSSSGSGALDSLSTASFAASSSQYYSSLSSEHQQTSLSSSTNGDDDGGGGGSSGAVASVNGQQQSIVNSNNNNNNSNNSNNNKNRINNNSVSGNGGSSNGNGGTKHKQLCKISEWKCSNGTCISLSKYCDGSADCSDGGDEPSQCSGKWTQILYEILLHKTEGKKW